MEKQTEPKPLGLSMAKVILVVVVIVSIGAVLGVAGYLMTKPKVVPPITENDVCEKVSSVNIKSLNVENNDIGKKAMEQQFGIDWYKKYQISGFVGDAGKYPTISSGKFIQLSSVENIPRLALFTTGDKVYFLEECNFNKFIALNSDSSIGDKYDAMSAFQLYIRLYGLQYSGHLSEEPIKWYEEDIKKLDDEWFITSDTQTLKSTYPGIIPSPTDEIVVHYKAKVSPNGMIYIIDRKEKVYEQKYPAGPR